MILKAVALMSNLVTSEVVRASVVLGYLGDMMRGTFADALGYFGACACFFSLNHFTAGMEATADYFRIQTEPLPIADR
jgi:hypothetical protein